MKIRCCYGCEERQIGCHATCERYLAEKEALDQERESKYKKHEERNIIWDTYLRGIKNMKGKRAKNNEKAKRK
jgi:hypothetical protein